MTNESSNDVPSGWARATVGDTGQYVNGMAFKPSDWGETGLPIIRIQNLTDPTKPLNRTNRQAESIYKVQRGDILVSWSATLDAFVWDREEALLNQHIFKVIPDVRLVQHRFLYYLLRFAIAAMKKSAHLHGSTMRHINRTPFLTFPVCLPPLKEQQRIADEIERHLTRLEASMAELQRARANLKRYRTAVLQAACEGRLVPTEAELARAEGGGYEPADVLLVRILKERRASWEADQLAKMRAAGKEPKDDKWKPKYVEPQAPDTSGLPELPEGWAWTTFDHAICGGPQNGLYKPASAYGDGMPILRIEDYQDGFLRPRDELRRLNVNEDEARIYGLNPDDLVINRVNSPSHLGKSVVVPSTLCPAVFESNMMRMVVAKDIAPKWILLYIRSRSGRTRLTAGAKWAVNQASINQTDVRVTPLSLPPLAEQGRIVAEVERRLSLVDELEGIVEHSLKRAQRLRQAVLKRAFEGKLVPQDPNDEPASVLLERIRAERAALAHARNSRRGRRASSKRRMRKTPAPLAERQTGVAE